MQNFFHFLHGDMIMFRRFIYKYWSNDLQKPRHATKAKSVLYQEIIK